VLLALVPAVLVWLVVVELGLTLPGLVLLLMLLKVVVTAALELR